MLHADTLNIDPRALRRAVDRARPDLAGRPLRRLKGPGTERWIFRLGAELCVRLPMTASARVGLATEAAWLPRLAPHLPLALPRLVHVGSEAAGLPGPWLLQEFLPGRTAFEQPPDDLTETARQLGDLVLALRHLPLTELPEQTGRGADLALREPPFLAALEQARTMTDTAAALRLWRLGRDAPAWRGAPVALHADLTPTNLIVRDGRLAGLIDLGNLSQGDPAYDLTPAWFMLDAAARRVFRDAVQADEAMWRRGRACAVWQAILALPYYARSNPVLVLMAHRVLSAAASEP